MNEFTTAELVALRREHTPTTIPPCHLCGGPMAQMGGVIDGRAIHVCLRTIEDTEPGWMIHYRDSKTTYDVNPKGNPLIIRLIDEVMEYRRVLDELEAIR